MEKEILVSSNSPNFSFHKLSTGTIYMFWKDTENLLHHNSEVDELIRITSYETGVSKKFKIEKNILRWNIDKNSAQYPMFEDPFFRNVQTYSLQRGFRINVLPTKMIEPSPHEWGNVFLRIIPFTQLR